MLFGFCSVLVLAVAAGCSFEDELCPEQKKAVAISVTESALVKSSFPEGLLKQVKSMKAMGSLQPRIKKIQAQYKDDPMLMQAKLKELYAEIGVSPLDGCLPMIIQMPMLMAVYYALQSLTYEGNPSFLWIANLSEPDPTYILPVLSAATTYVVSAQTAAEGNKSL